MTPEPLGFDLLIVDDEKSTADFLNDFFKEEGFEVRAVYSGKSALEEIRKKAPQLVLLDVQMPEMNGIETLKSIKKANPGIRVLMVTGENDPETIEQVLQAGADHYVMKPFRVRDLIKQVHEIFSQLKK